MPRVLFVLAACFLAARGFAQETAPDFFDLGVRYQNGDGVPRDPARAAEWYRKAADAGHLAAQIALAAMYYNGEGVPQDAGKAVEWYTKAAQQGDTVAQVALGLIYG